MHSRFFLWITFCLLVLQVSAQEGILRGRIEHVDHKRDVLQLYVTGHVDVKPIDLQEDGTFGVSVDLLERTRVVLFWHGRPAAEDWSCVAWLQPDSVLTANLSLHRVNRVQTPRVTFSGAHAALSTYSNLYYQAFERQNVFDEAHLAPLPTFQACQTYIESVLQPLGEQLLELSPADFVTEETDGFGEELDSLEQTDPVEEQRRELDRLQVEAEFSYALQAERKGQHMAQDTSFAKRLAEIDVEDVEQADAIYAMVKWRSVVDSTRLLPLQDEAAMLRCLTGVAQDQEVRNAVADRIMQHFFLRVQMGEVDPSDPACRTLYEEFRKVSDEGTYEDFIATHLDIMEHPALYDENVSEEDSDPDAEEEGDTEAEPLHVGPAARSRQGTRVQGGQGEQPMTFVPGMQVPDGVIRQCGASSFFHETALPDTIFQRMQGRSYRKGCTVPRDSLRYLLCLHRDAEGRAWVGEMVVHRRIASRVLHIFRQLFAASYPIERMRLVDYYEGDDERSMQANNTSAFNFRYISHTHTVSKHGMGLAVDVNTRYNPYYRRLRSGAVLVAPASGRPYVNRARSFPYKIIKGDLCYRLFVSQGFVWGGDWKYSKDYQHFEWR